VDVLVVMFLGRCGNVAGVRTLIVSANLALMLSAVFAPFFGAILLVFGGVVGRWSRSSLVVWLLKSEYQVKNSTCACLQKFETLCKCGKGRVLRDAPDMPYYSTNTNVQQEYGPRTKQPTIDRQCLAVGGWWML
jgi:hypothetical protein